MVRRVPATACSYNEPVSEFRSYIEGVYDLAQWRRGDASFGPPRAAGRIAYLNGTVTLVMRCDGGDWESHRYGIGRYAIEGDRLLYGYDRMFDYSRDGNDVRVTPEAPVAGLRPYRLREVDGELLCDGENHGSRLRFSREGLEVSDGGRAARLWRRIP